MSVTVSGTSNGHQEWLLVTAAAHLARVSERTVQRRSTAPCADRRKAPTRHDQRRVGAKV
jgi:hypothetical protein